MNIYLDNISTTKINPKVLEEMYNFDKNYFANENSSHQLGVKVKSELIKARKIIANSINAYENEIYFTSSGSEANSLAIIGTTNANNLKNKHIISTNSEHSSSSKAIEFLRNQNVEITLIEQDENGFINPKKIENSIKENTILISIIGVNNETGVINNIKEIGKIAKNHNIYCHIDFVQGFMKINANMKENFKDIDLLSVSAHKIYGPKGIGFLFVREKTKILPIIFGGEQENELRGGTINSSSIIGFKIAIEEFLKNQNTILEKEKKLYNYLIEKLKHLDYIHFNSKITNHHIKNIVNFSIKNKDTNKLATMLDLKGIYISQGSACRAGITKISNVIRGMYNNYDEKNNKILINNEYFINGVIRVGLSYTNKFEDIDNLIKVITKFIEK